MYTESTTYRAGFEANSIEEAEAKLQAIFYGNDETWLNELPGYWEKIKGNEPEVELDTLEEVK